MGGSTVWLVGMMGAGKSAVGRALAELQGTPFEDSDALIEARARRSIAEIFSEHGEPAFRRLEREVIDSLAGRPGVVALGGGAICQPGAPERLRGRGTVAYLRATPETLARRVGEAATRPLLAGLDVDARLERIRELLADREIHYGQADVTLDTDTLDIDAASAALARALEAREGQAP